MDDKDDYYERLLRVSDWIIECLKEKLAEQEQKIANYEAIIDDLKEQVM